MSFKQLGANDLTSSTNTDVYTVTTDYETVVSTILFNNRASSARSIRLYHVPSGQSTGVTYAIAYDKSIEANGILYFQIGICMEAGDKIVAYANGASVTVMAWGNEMRAN